MSLQMQQVGLAFSTSLGEEAESLIVNDGTQEPHPSFPLAKKVKPTQTKQRFPLGETFLILAKTRVCFRKVQSKERPFETKLEAVNRTGPLKHGNNFTDSMACISGVIGNGMNPGIPE